MPPLRTDLSDAALIERTRHGDRSAYAELWRRHAASARTVARSYSSLDSDDLVAESFTKIYDAILAGGGPTGAFRPYLFTTLRNTAASWGRGRREANLETLESFEDPATTESATLDALDRSTTAQAFRSLPTRWQEVLWYSEVEGMAPQQIAPLVGMTANAAAALAYRAREGLRQAWIQAHLRNAVNEPECRWTIDRLGSYTRGRLRSRDTAKLEAHLDDCARCTIVAAEAREVGSRLALVLLPLTAGIGGATAYSAWLSQGAPAVDLALGATGSPAVLVGAGGAQGAASGAASGGAASGSGAATGSGGVSGSVSGGASGAGSLGGGGIAVAAGVGTIVLAAAVVAVVVAVPSLMTAANEGAASVAVEAQPYSLPDVGGPVLPEPVLPGAVLPEPVDPETAPPVDPMDSDEADEPSSGEPTDPSAGPVAEPPSPAIVPSPSPSPSPEPEPEPGPDPVDDTAVPPTFAVDTAGGLVDPLVTGTADAGARIVVSAGDGRTWIAVADATGAWSVLVGGLPAGTTLLTAVQTDAAGNTSPASAPVAVVLASPSLELRGSGPLVWHLTFAGMPGATVQVLGAGIPLTSIVLDDAGSARFIALGWTEPGSAIGVRYTAGGRTGPTAPATLGDVG